MVNRDYQLAQLCRASYYANTGASGREGKQLTALGYEDIQAVVCEETDTEAFVCVKGNEVFVVFRGTEFEWRDFMTDARFLRRPITSKLHGRELELHGGFTEAYCSIAPALMEAVLEAQVNLNYYKDVQETPKVTMTGHSLGGALAHIAGICMHSHSIVTFGEPRVGGKALNELTTEHPNYRRYTLGWDAVANVPFGFGYRHPDVGRIHLPSRSWWPSPITDHSILAYEEALA